MLLPHRLPAGLMGKSHKHTRGQLICPQYGRLRIKACKKEWVVSRLQALWIPSGVVHSVETLDDLFVYNVYVDTKTVVGLPKHCKIIFVSPLLHELLNYCLTLHPKNKFSPEFIRILRVIIDQILIADDLGIYLPILKDTRIKTITEQLLNQPDDNKKLGEWAVITHSSERNLARLFIRETGLTFSQWRQHLRVIVAISHLGEGVPVLTVSLDMGYASQSAFISMFKKVTGCTPSAFIQRGALGKITKITPPKIM